MDKLTTLENKIAIDLVTQINYRHTDTKMLRTLEYK